MVTKQQRPYSVQSALQSSAEIPESLAVVLCVLCVVVLRVFKMPQLEKELQPGETKTVKFVLNSIFKRYDSI